MRPKLWMKKMWDQYPVKIIQPGTQVISIQIFSKKDQLYFLWQSLELFKTRAIKNPKYLSNFYKFQILKLLMVDKLHVKEHRWLQSPIREIRFAQRLYPYCLKYTIAGSWIGQTRHLSIIKRKIKNFRSWISLFWSLWLFRLALDKFICFSNSDFTLKALKMAMPFVCCELCFLSKLVQILHFASSSVNKMPTVALSQIQRAAEPSHLIAPSWILTRVPKLIHQQPNFSVFTEPNVARVSST